MQNHRYNPELPENPELRGLGVSRKSRDGPRNTLFLRKYYPFLLISAHIPDTPNTPELPTYEKFTCELSTCDLPQSYLSPNDPPTRDLLIPDILTRHILTYELLNFELFIPHILTSGPLTSHILICSPVGSELHYYLGG